MCRTESPATSTGSGAWVRASVFDCHVRASGHVGGALTDRLSGKAGRAYLVHDHAFALQHNAHRPPLTAAGKPLSAKG